ncbi:MAG TPA: glycosyltransferase family 39 protein [Polyangia bacterium]
MNLLARIDARFPAAQRPAPRPGVVVALVALAVLAFTAATLSLGAYRRQPRYDEVSYLQLARDYHRMGGAPEVVRCHLNGLCREDNRFPAFALLLQAFAHARPEFFADAKLLTFATALLLLATAGLLTARAFGPAAGVVAVVLLALMPTLNEIASSILADVLYAVTLLIAVRAIADALERGATAWLGAGALVGLAYLTKGNAHLALLALMTAAFMLHGPRIFLTARPYAAVAGFVAVTFFLLWRNAIDYGGNPFHNFNDRSIWLDSWPETVRLMRTPEWQRIGVGWYLRHHSLGALAWRLVKGLGQTLGALCYTSGLGITSGTPVRMSTSVPSAIFRIASGVGVLALAARGLFDRHRSGHRAEVVAVLHVTGWLLLAFAVGGQGVGGVATRFMLPLTVLHVPYAALALVTHLGPRLRPAHAVGVVALLLAIKAATFAGGLTSNPRRAFDIPPDWAETSAWLAQHLQPGERYAFPYGSFYSTWDQPAPDPDARAAYDYTTKATDLLAAMDEARPVSIEARWDGPRHPIRKMFVDMADADLPRYREKLAGAADAHGPLAFLGWNRCFADTRQPSRFLIFCR